jgi:hypothetical protein
LGELAEFHFGHPADTGLFDKRLVFLVQRVLGCSGSRAGARRARLSEGYGANNDPERKHGCSGEQANQWDLQFRT